jgi:hypothetical protein
VIIIPEDREILEKIAATGGILSKEDLEGISIDLLEKAAEGTEEYLKFLQLAKILKADTCISRKMRECMADGKDQDQALAIAYSECGEEDVKKSSKWVTIKINGKETPTDDFGSSNGSINLNFPRDQFVTNLPFDNLEVESPQLYKALGQTIITAITDEKIVKGNGCHDPSCGKFCASDSEHNFKLLPQEGTDVAIIKTDEDQQIIFGIALQPAPFVDLQGDVIAKEEIESAAHDFLVKSRAVGYRHKEMLEKRADVIESYVAPTDINWNGNVIKEGSWVVGVKIHDPQIWQKVKNKELNSFSIGGKGKRTPSL